VDRVEARAEAARAEEATVVAAQEVVVMAAGVRAEEVMVVEVKAAAREAAAREAAEREAAEREAAARAVVMGAVVRAAVAAHRARGAALESGAVATGWEVVVRASEVATEAPRGVWCTCLCSTRFRWFGAQNRRRSARMYDPGTV